MLLFLKVQNCDLCSTFKKELEFGFETVQGPKIRESYIKIRHLFSEVSSVGPKAKGLRPQPKILDLRLRLRWPKFEEIPTAVGNFLINFSFLVCFFQNGSLNENFVDYNPSRL